MDTILIILILIGIFAQQQEYDCFSVRSTTGLKGVMIICIILHHIAQRTTDGTLIRIFQHVGYLFVAVFLLISGYGLMVSYRSADRKQYIKEYWRKKFRKVIFPYIIFSGCSFIHYRFFLGESVDFIGHMRGGVTMLPTAWFFWTILIFYGIYYMAILCNNGKGVVFITGGGTLIYIIVCILLGYERYWWCSVPAFWAGLFLGSLNNGERLKYYVYKYGMTVSIFLYMFYKLVIRLPQLIHYNFTEDILMFAVCAPFALIILLVSSKCNLSSNLFQKVGAASMEIYMAQGLMRQVLGQNNLPDGLYAIIMLTGGLGLGIGANKLFNHIWKRGTCRK